MLYPLPASLPIPYRRVTLIAENARIVRVFYPVFPPDANAGEVLDWLRGRA